MDASDVGVGVAQASTGDGLWETHPAIVRHPANPILSADDLPYPGALVFNAGVTRWRGEYLMIFRNDLGDRHTRTLKGGRALGLARSVDGVAWTVDPEPLRLTDEPDNLMRLAYDPRLTVLEDRLYLCFATGDHGTCGGLAVTDDLKRWELLALTAPDNRNMALDPEPYRRDLAVRLGAAAAFDPTTAEGRDNVRGAIGEAGIHKAIECSGQDVAARLLMDLAGIRGAIAFVGENAGTIPISPSRDLIRKGLTLMGCWHMNMLDASGVIAFLQRHPEKADALISHRFPFDRVDEAFGVFASRQSAKVILHPWA